MKKKVLLIGNTNGLPGVPVDMKNYREFFKSQVGGAWRDDEIVEFTNPSKVQVLLKLLSMKVANLDYLIVVFSGHGGYFRGTSKTLLELNKKGEGIYDVELFNTCKKQLSIIDCCRDVCDAEVVIEAKRAAFNVQAQVPTRERYEKRIAQAVDQQVALYACSAGQFSYDTSKGGRFSCNFLNEATSISSYSNSYRTVKKAFNGAKLTTRYQSMIAQNDPVQDPEMVSSYDYTEEQSLIIGIV